MAKKPKNAKKSEKIVDIVFLANHADFADFSIHLKAKRMHLKYESGLQPSGGRKNIRPFYFKF
ncbi:hypothetical protein [Chryseobacterium timonianum]|uniref:hypothetical protein n=1 Tax=Chryseobacterium timonianum TaxID=1805473 RepID=UPI00083A10FE|nr:hypothetical protein [Chryseobacterium timonianum]